VNWPAESATFAMDAQTVERVSGLTASALRIPEIVSVLAWRDGTRQLIGRDGSSLWMEPTEWRGGTQLTQQLDASVPESLRIPVPDRPDTFQPMPPAQLAAAASIRFAGTVPGQTVIAAMCFVLAVVILSEGHTLVGSALVVVTLCIAARVGLVLRPLPSAGEQDELTTA
jgi:hypothetical protein